MASLEELLAEDGFKKKVRPRPGARTLPPSRTVSMPPYHGHTDSKHTRDSARSSVYSARSEPVNEAARGERRTSSRLGRRRSIGARPDRVSQDAKDFEASSSIETREVEGYDGRTQPQSSNLVKEIEAHGGGGSNGVKEIEEEGGNEIQEIEESEDREATHFLEIQTYKKKYTNTLFEDEMTTNWKERKLQVRPSFTDDHRGRRNDEPKNSDSEPALDDAAIRAVVAILTAYTRRFLKDEKFRASIRRGCDACLGIGGANESYDKSGGALANLREAMMTVERVAQQVPDMVDLRKASLKLSVITSLGSKELKDEYNSGIPNLHLVACAHVYLAVIYKLRKKDKVAAKHLLQVFCESPHQARTTLLPGLWDHLFFPHLSHLRVWYDKETESITRTTKIKLLDKVYSQALDMGTYQFAVYYRGWLMEETDGPALPSIQVPHASFHGILEEDYHSDRISSPRISVSSQTMVSKKLYQSVFSNSAKKMKVRNEIKSRDDEEDGEVQLNRHPRRSVTIIQEHDSSETCSPNRRTRRDHVKEDHQVCSPNRDAPLEADEWTGTEGLDITEIKELDAECEDISSSRGVARSIRGSNLVTKAKGNERTLKKLAQAAFQPQVEHQSGDADTVNMKHSSILPVYDLYQSNPSNIRCTESKMKNNWMIYTNSLIGSFKSNSSAETLRNFEEIDQGSLISTIPKDFICPKTGHLFRDPVTLETGQTFERAVVKEWFDKGNRTCPVTGRELECLSVPVTNFVLKSVIDVWKSAHFRNLLAFATQIAGNTIKHDSNPQDGSAVFIIEQLLTGFSIEEQMANAKHLISLGGLNFLLQRFELGNLEEKTCVASLMLCCIKAEGSCRSYLATNIRRHCILELLHSKQANALTNAVFLLIELIHLNRRMAIKSFISGLQTEEIVITMHVLLVHLQSSLSEERILVAVLLLHLDLLVEPQRYTIFREEIVNSIIMGLDCCLTDNKVIPNTRRALLMLGGHFSSSGEILTETWLLKQAGFYDDSGVVSTENEYEVDEMVLGEEEAKAREQWLKNVSLVLVCHGKKSFLETLSKCLGSENPELARASLTMVAWLSCALAFLSIAEIQISAFSVLIPLLKDSLEESQQIEHRVLACLSLLNFSKISECKALLMTFAKEISIPLKSLVEVTWTAKHLHTSILGECL